MIRKLEPAGTLLFGRQMIAQLTVEIDRAGARAPVLISLASDRRMARRAARKLTPGFPGGIPHVSGEVPSDADFLILAGGKALADRFSRDTRPRALLPLNRADLDEIDRPMSDYLVVDRSLVPTGSTQEFFRRYARAVSDGSASMPGTLTIPPSFVYNCRTRILSGPDSLAELPALLRAAGVVKPLILTDEGLVSVGLADRLKETLSGFDLRLFDGIPPDSDSRVVERIVTKYREEERDGLVAFGGGSVLDTGKGVYLGVSLDGGTLSERAGSNRIPRLGTPFFAVPTTSGTGSEVTKVAVISDVDKGRKVLYVSSNLQPDAAILDGTLSTGLPPYLTSITGIDALSHAVEAFTCLGKNPMSDQMAWGAVERIRGNLIPLMDDPGNPGMRSEMALASMLAGQAFSNSMVGMVHTIGHSIGAVCHAPHGACMSVLLPPSMEYNLPLTAVHLARLLPALAGEDAADGLSEADAAAAFIAKLREMNRILREKTGGRHPERLRDIMNAEGTPAVKPGDFEAVARLALGDASIAYNPRELGFADIMDVLEGAY